MRVAIVHDFLSQRGGAERVAAAIASMFPGAPVFTAFYDPDATHDDFRGRDVKTTFLQGLPHSAGAFRALLPLYPLAFRLIELGDFDLVISSSTNFAHRVRAGRGFHAVYCHNPPRWLYQTEEYLPSRTSRILLSPLLAMLRRGDRRAAAGPDLYLCNSRVVAGRIQRLYGREATVVNPPIQTARFDGALAARKQGTPGRHYLVVSRLLAHKHVDLVVRTCVQRGEELVVVGDGPERQALERLAGPTVTFAGKVVDDELMDLFAGARALVHCAEEDFGLVLLEAAAAGVPSVAFRPGGASEIVIDAVTGVLFDDRSEQALGAALDRASAIHWDPAALRDHADRFGEGPFRARFRAALESALGAPLDDWPDQKSRHNLPPATP